MERSKAFKARLEYERNCEAKYDRHGRPSILPPEGERMMGKSVVKYDWSNAPLWAKYAAFDADGEAHWFNIKPTSFAGYWSHPNARKERIDIPYQYTLEDRPEGI